MERVLADIRADTLFEEEHRERASSLGGKGGTAMGASGVRKANGVNGVGGGAMLAIGSRKSGEGSLAVPRAVVEEGLRVTRECLEVVCEVDV